MEEVLGGTFFYAMTFGQKTTCRKSVASQSNKSILIKVDSMVVDLLSRGQFHESKVERNSTTRNFTPNFNRLFSTFVLDQCMFTLKF